MTERNKQRRAALEQARMKGENLVWGYTFRCEDGQHFFAIATSDPGAFRVLNAERPGARAELLCSEQFEVDRVSLVKEE